METSQTVQRALRLMGCFTEEAPTLTIAELARALDLPRTITSRLVNTLVVEGMLERASGDGSLSLGAATLELGARYANSNPWFKMAAGTVDRIAIDSGYTSYLGVVRGRTTVILHRKIGPQPIQVVQSAAFRMPATLSALGKAVLMHRDPAEVATEFGSDSLDILTEHSIATIDELFGDLEASRARGYTTVVNEGMIGLTSVGAAILDADGNPVAGMSIGWANAGTDEALVAALGERVVEATRAASEMLRMHVDLGQIPLLGELRNA